MSRIGQFLAYAGCLVALPLFCFGVCLTPTGARAAPSAVAGAVSSSKTAQTALTLRFAALDRISGEDPELPAALLQRYRGTTVQVTYQVCVRSDGSVMMVSRRSGIAEADPAILPTLRAWRYPPQPAHTMTCVHEIFEFSQ